MKNQRKLNRKSKNTFSNYVQPLKTEYPLCEKDEQARVIELMKKMQKDVLRLWRALKERSK